MAKIQDTEELIRSAHAVVALRVRDGELAMLDDASLLRAGETIAFLRHQVDSYAARVAGEIARRSHASLGSGGMAQKAGYRTAERMVESVTHGTAHDAVALVQVGIILAHTDAAEALSEARPGRPCEAPWQAGIAHAVSEGDLSVPHAQAIVSGLGEPSERISGEALAAAAADLMAGAVETSARSLHQRARRARDELDEVGILERENAQLDAQYLKAWRRPDGMVAGNFLYAPENGEYLLSALELVTSPRRGGPRFVAKDDRARADKIMADPRSDERMVAEAMLELIRHGAATDPGTVYASSRPAVRIIATQAAIDTEAGTGHGIIEGSGQSVSAKTLDRLRCDSGTVTITLDATGQCINVEREQRLFTQRQRIGLAARDGGCRWPGCDRPPSWCEAHHCRHWVRDVGKTNIDNGVLLCRHHHLLLHNNSWDITHTGGRYWLTPPRSVDPLQKPRPMPTKNPLLRRIATTAAAGKS